MNIPISKRFRIWRDKNHGYGGVRINLLCLTLLLRIHWKDVEWAFPSRRMTGITIGWVGFDCKEGDIIPAKTIAHKYTVWQREVPE